MAITKQSPATMAKDSPTATMAKDSPTATVAPASYSKVGSDSPHAKAVIPDFVMEGKRALEASTKDLDDDIAATVVMQDKVSLQTALLMQICRNTKKGK